MTGYPVVMSLDHTLASNHRGNTFFGFGACLPGRLAPEAFFRAVAWPSASPTPQGGIGTADCGSRRIEASLRDAGFGFDDFLFAHPDRLDEAIGPATRVFLIGSHDPLGRGPLARLFATLWGGGEPYNARSVARILRHPTLRRVRPVVIAGGGGAWEWATDPRARRRYGVDCVVIGEAETTVPNLVRRALSGQQLPEVVNGQTVAVEKIPRLKGPTAGGVVEATRGCGRGCHFCVPNLVRLRSLPVEDILADVAVNLRAGQDRIVLHAEDIFRYGNTGGFAVNEEAICGLFESVARTAGVRTVSASHATLSGALAAPGILSRLAGILGLGRPGRPEYGAFQIGIETGSVRMAKRHLAQKMAPFSPEDWPEVVRQGVAHLWENRFYAVYTLVVGLPGEADEDVRETIRLVRELRKYPCLIFPLFFVPMALAWTAEERALIPEAITPVQAELIAAAFEHNNEWAGRIWTLYGRYNNFLYRKLAMALVTRLTAMAMRRARRLVVAAGAPAGPRLGEWYPPLEPPPRRTLPASSQANGVGCPLPATLEAKAPVKTAQVG